jgi:hypothetical protein
MATFNLFLNASQADSAITNSYRLFHPNGLTGQSLSLYGGNINHWGKINSTQLYITGDIGEESFIKRLTGGIRVVGDCEFDRILNGVDILGTSYIQTLTGGLNVTNGGANIVGNSVNNGSFRNVGAVSVTGPAAITGETRIVGNTDIRGNFFQSGVFDVISSDAEFRGNVDITGTLDVNGPLAVNGTTTITSAGGLTISGPATINGNSTLNGITNVVGELQLNGQPFFTQQLNETTEINYFLTGGECVALLENNAGDIVLTSKTGLIPRNQGPTITGTTRGSYAVDLQLNRTSTTQVAAGNYSVLIGGRENKAEGEASVSIGGTGNYAAGNSASVIGGNQNSGEGQRSTILGGQRNRITSSTSASSIIGGVLNSGNSSTSVVLGGTENRTNATHSVAFGTKARTYNIGELVQGSFYGQRGWIMGGYYGGGGGLNEGSSAFLWGDFNYATPNSGFLINGVSFVKFRICKKTIGTCNYSEDEFSIAANYAENLITTTKGTSSGYRVAFSNTPASMLTIEPTGFTGFIATISADIMYSSSYGGSWGCETTTSAPIAFNSNPDLDTLFS